jgi:hypothetical protein
MCTSHLITNVKAQQTAVVAVVVTLQHSSLMSLNHVPPLNKYLLLSDMQTLSQAPHIVQTNLDTTLQNKDHIQLQHVPLTADVSQFAMGSNKNGDHNHWNARGGIVVKMVVCLRCHKQTVIKVMVQLLVLLSV